MRHSEAATAPPHGVYAKSKANIFVYLHRGKNTILLQQSFARSHRLRQWQKQLVSRRSFVLNPPPKKKPTNRTQKSHHDNFNFGHALRTKQVNPSFLGASSVRWAALLFHATKIFAARRAYLVRIFSAAPSALASAVRFLSLIHI